jgi:hypothetical protein
MSSCSRSFSRRKLGQLPPLIAGQRAVIPGAGVPEGRDTQPLADWLAACPGSRSSAETRSGSYADGARTGAPDAVQVADGFHLWQNLAKAVEKVRRRPPRLTGRARCPAADGPEPESTRPTDADPPDRRCGKLADTARRTHELVHRPGAERHGLREVARHPGLGPAHRPALRPRRHLAGARRRPLAGRAAQQARPVQALPRPARRRRPRQLHAPFKEIRCWATTAAAPSSATTPTTSARRRGRCARACRPSGTSRAPDPAAYPRGLLGEGLSSSSLVSP